ncbi:MAG: hypothetical protein KDJ29_20950 [Hyphomicrobiales bacterium]|nr:hypothetical protein [Hyphomicrobiales bacterium]
MDQIKQPDIANLSAFASSIVSTFLKFKNDYDLDYDEVLIFLALGRMNFEHGKGGLMYVKPASIVSMVAYLDVPRETLRRKMLLLEERGPVQRNGSGYVVKDLADWMVFDELASSGSRVTAAD